MWHYGYPYEDHGDGQADERWRRALTREDAMNDMENAGFPLSDVPDRIQSGNMWDHVHPQNDLYVPEHERRDPILSADELIEDILGGSS
jgi:hypothetical protein